MAIHGDERVVRYLPWGVRDRAELAGVLEEKARRTRLEREGDGLNLAGVDAQTGALVADLIADVAQRGAPPGRGRLHPASGPRGARVRDRGGAGACSRSASTGSACTGSTAASTRRNAASARVLERLGMRREAHLVENEHLKGEWTDEVVYALLAREWVTRGWGRVSALTKSSSWRVVQHSYSSQNGA